MRAAGALAVDALCESSVLLLAQPFLSANKHDEADNDDDNIEDLFKNRHQLSGSRTMCGSRCFVARLTLNSRKSRLSCLITLPHCCQPLKLSFELVDASLFNGAHITGMRFP